MPPPVRPLRLAPEWDGRFTRMCGVSLVAHGMVVVAVIMLTVNAGPRPLPLVAYTVELTDPNAVPGGRLPPGAPGRDLSGGAAKAAPAEAKVEPAPPPAPPPAAEPPRPPEPPPKVEEPAAEVPKPPEPPPVAKAEAKPPEPKAAEPEPLAKPEAKKPEPPKAEAKRAEPPKPEVKKPEPARAEAPAKPAPPKPAEHAPDKAAGGAQAAAKGAPGEADAYAAAAERWRTRVGSKAGNGLGGADTGSGPVGTGGGAGGGQLVGVEFLAYRQQVINTIKGRWTNVVARPGLVAIVRFEISPAGEVSNIRLEQGSGNGTYDGSVLRAVQRSSPLPAPPARYAKEFREFLIEFHSEEQGGQGAG